MIAAEWGAGLVPLLAAAAVLGAIIGSFLGAALERMPTGRSVLHGRSECDSCGKSLTVTELVPLVSWAVQRGVCRECRAPIGLWQLACELGAAAIGVAAVLWSAFPLAAMALGWQLLLLALLDLRHMWLPRALTGLLAGSGALSAIALALRAHDPMVLAVAAAGGAFGYGILWLLALLYRRVRGREGLGEGDPPLLGAIGLWIGPLGVIHTLLIASLGGLVVAAALHFGGRKIGAETALPLGTCLAAAAWPIFLWQGLG